MKWLCLFNTIPSNCISILISLFLFKITHNFANYLPWTIKDKFIRKDTLALCYCLVTGRLIISKYNITCEISLSQLLYLYCLVNLLKVLRQLLKVKYSSVTKSKIFTIWHLKINWSNESQNNIKKYFWRHIHSK